MPTILPERRRTAETVAPRKPTVFSILLNGFMLVTALALTFVVLLTEERYAQGPNWERMVSEQMNPDKPASP